MVAKASMPTWVAFSGSSRCAIRHDRLARVGGEAVGPGRNSGVDDGARVVDVVGDVLADGDLGGDASRRRPHHGRESGREPRGWAKWRVLTTGTPRIRTEVTAASSAAVM